MERASVEERADSRRLAAHRCRIGRCGSVLRTGLRSEEGFSLVECMVAAAVMVAVLAGFLTLIDSSTRLAKQETNVSLAQQGARTGIFELGRIVRQARAGHLFYANAVLPLANNSPGGVFYTDLSGVPHYVRKGTDVLGVRGVLLGDSYTFTSGDVTCGGIPCDSTAPMTITIRSTSPNGAVNFRSGDLPSIALKTRPFYFSVVYGTLQTITIANTSFLIPLYYVGLVDTTGAWYTRTADTFTFVMDPTDDGARLRNAITGTVRELVQSPYTGGPVDEVVFFVDEGPADASGSRLDTHPVLVEAIFDPSTGRHDVQPLAGDVEDFQVAYGVDGADGSSHDRGVSPGVVDTTSAALDEWVGNVATEVETSLPFSTEEPHFIDAFIDRTVAPGVPNLFSRAVPTLRSVLLSIVVKGQHPDPKYAGPAARGYQTLDSTAVPFSSPAMTGLPYRRRVQSLAVSLRNYQ